MTNVLEQIKGATAYDPSGEKIGKIHELYLDGQSREPKWASVHTGLFGMTESLVPLAGARPDGEDSVRVAVAKSAVKDAPHVDIGERISPADEATLAQYYGLRSTRPTSPPPSPQPGPDSAPSNGGKHLRGAAPALGGIGGTSANTTANTSARTHTEPEMIRSEERLQVGTERTTSGTARLNKHVVTEQRTVQVPVTHEEVRVERAAITDPAQARDARLADDQREVTLHEDQVVVSKESVPVERVRLAVDEVTENKHVTEDVRREEINADGVERRRR
ncbi:MULTISPECIES: PRC and DUF2382 domain-containing protein [Mycolicibacterium]|jgi:uncharacterized protein (TIGR02271 family)|uniref:DUF2382 domain-containing protein n=1 Tax=Mycolicibacterium mucogenicum TaxID=56689 RepID=A0A1A0M9M2_MYCMU|nr:MULTISPECIES: PRC and DUF2382 domain-containing protein [Mycolicibacterium]OBA82184.1 hypothetical protein A5642_27655 [Mycolicibacterium mucogenicum]UCZ62173.1 PRC and DUF2382 domain-containing protein [Mycolicibacterium phocaicum]